MNKTGNYFVYIQQGAHCLKSDCRHLTFIAHFELQMRQFAAI